MRTRTQRILAAALMLVMLLSLAPMAWAEEGGDGASGDTVLPADAGEGGAPVVPDETPKACSINVQFAGDTSGYLEDLETVSPVYDLYLVANVKDPEGAYRIELTEPFAGLTLPDRGINDQAGEQWSKLADEALKIVANDTSLPTVAPDALTQGVYLVVPHNDGATDYFKTVKKTVTGEDGTETTTEELVSIVETDAYVYQYGAHLIALPMKTADTTATQATWDEGEWIYEGIKVVLKPEQKPRNGNLKIVKTLNGYVGPDPAKFVFKIEATYKGEKVYSDVRAITFTADGSGEVVLEKLIPVGAEVTVTEVYQGSRYELVGEGTFFIEQIGEDGNIVVVPADSLIIRENPSVARVDFSNKHDNTDTGGTGVVNTYTYDETAGDFVGPGGNGTAVTQDDATPAAAE